MYLCVVNSRIGLWGLWVGVCIEAWIIEHTELDWKRARRPILNIRVVGTPFD